MNDCQKQIDDAWVEFRATISKKVVTEAQALINRVQTGEISAREAQIALSAIFMATSGVIDEEMLRILEMAESSMRLMSTNGVKR